ncbi:hypothetical protein, partial [Pseudomonas coronafaciens]|uniref:hypothetical protein n=1 Tax=Pseudomonas coronafaciens TaxID=53409 RepID=UPI0019686862
LFLLENEVGSLAFEFRGKGTALLGHQTPLCGEHSRLNGCPESLDHYTVLVESHPETRKPRNARL